nr:ParB N-terminal domain-containing protein [Brevundimonas naejangsanensis]
MDTKIHELAPDELKLDLDNPRFGLTDAADEPEALRILATRANLRELWDSINQRGFEPYEPLVAFRDTDGKYVVVEGNRRLAAVKSLLQPSLLDGVRITPPILAASAAGSLKTLPVMVVNHREDADDYIGFKHINGPSTWGALAKAKFGVKLFAKTVVAPGQADTRIQALSKRLGDSRQLILRSLVAYKIFEQAKAEQMLDDAMVEESAFDFSHLYTIIQSPNARQYLGLTQAPLNESLIKDNPIPPSHREKLQFLMSWLFGADGKDSVIKSQGTDRPKLAKILGSERATETLEATGEFDLAADEAGFRTENWLNLVLQLGTVSKHVSDGVTELPNDMDPANVVKALERLAASQRIISLAQVQLKTLFP